MADSKEPQKRKRGRGADPAQTKAELLGAAIESLTDIGFSGTTARSIAERAGCNQAAIYYHFGGIEELIIASFAQSSQSRLRRYEEELHSGQSLVEIIELIERLYVDDRASGHLTLMAEVVGGITSSPGLRDGVAEATAPWLAFVEERIRDASSQLSFGAFLPAADLADLIFSVVLGNELRIKIDGDLERSDRLFRLSKLAAGMVAGNSPG